MRTIKATLLALVGLALGAALAEAAEKSEAQKKLLAKYDANKDGRLSASEREKILGSRLAPDTRHARFERLLSLLREVGGVELQPSRALGRGGLARHGRQAVGFGTLTKLPIRVPFSFGQTIRR